MKIHKEDIQVIEMMLMDQHKRTDEVAKLFGVTRVRIFQIRKQYGINPYRPIERVCVYCESKFMTTRALIRKGNGVYCNQTCYTNHKNEVGDYQPSRQGQRIARKTIEDWLGEALPVKCVVHHEDGNQKNNDINNLFIFPSHSEHLKYHHAKRHDNAILPYQELWELPDLLKSWF